MGLVHAALAWLAAAAIVVVVVVAAATGTGTLATHRWLDRAVLVQAAATLVAALAGAAAFATVRTLADPLHLLYGAVVAGTPLGVRVWAQGRDPRTIGRWVTIAGLVALGATVRSFMTGN